MKEPRLSNLMKISLAMLICALALGCVPFAKTVEFEGRMKKLESATLALVQGVQSGEIPVEQGLALIAQVDLERKALQKDWNTYKDAPWYTKLDAALTVVLGVGAVLGIPVAWIQRARALRAAAQAATSGRIGEALVGAVEVFSKSNPEAGKTLKNLASTKLSNAGVAAEGHDLVKAVTKPTGG